ncbi:hypothetical protein A3762_02380 [Oleiphilus sp. HI0125]|uniref:type II secretion system protein GspM n=1 Tax=Oleiphilus sp. HI0125 TaxID=1822266 RepID=UPI0007C35391|nr:type II secretion system protein M [Oleiphilus sp. HI0125]KZZ59380.1 hypothetical protein A3762_16905 [Oleiphilus sp. HI0125]KZZ61296.1 hypothetical protein A3762_02380 [Oleiphilus sp. HI0125]
MIKSPLFTQAKDRWESLEAREQFSLKVMFVAVVTSLMYFAMWVPAQSYMDRAEQDLKDKAALLELVKSSRDQLRSSSSNTSNASNLNSQQLVSTVTNMARKQSLNLKRFEPSGENKVKLWVEDVSFDTLVTWLSTLERSVGVQVEQISVEKEDKPGIVSARLTLSS